VFTVITFIMPRPLGGALSDDARLTSVCCIHRA